MKRFVLVLLVSFISFFVSAATITWIGISGSNWNNTANWSTGTVPTSADDVIFNTSVIVDMDILSATPYIINSLLITNSSNVELLRTQAGGGMRLLQVISTNAITKGLQIDAGSILLIHGVNTNLTGNLEFILDFAGAAGITGDISGELQFSGAGSGGTADRVRLRISTDISNNANLVVKNGGIIRYLPLTGNTTSSFTGIFLTMESGSQYIIEKTGGSFPSGGLWDANSLAKVTNLTGSNGPTFNGNSYGNLEWNCPSQSAISFLNSDISFNNVTFISNNNSAFRVRTGASVGVSTLTINGNLTLSSTSTVELTGNTVTSGNGGRIHLKGNLINAGIITTTGAGGTTNDFEINGTANQSLSNTGTFSGTRLLFIMNNAAGATLNTPLILPSNLALTSGKITTTTPNLLTMIEGSSYTGGSTTSFIDGPIKKIGNTDFTFPVGTGSIYAPIGISGGLGATVSDEFTAQYLRTNPQNVNGVVYDVGINHISYVEYWTLARVGAATKIVTLDVHPTSFAKVLANTFVTRFNTTGPPLNTWLNIASTPSALGPCVVPYQCGTTATTTAISSFGDFTLSTDLDFATNPLPVKLIKFSAIKISSSLAALNWQLAECCSKDALFELEKSSDSRNFVLLSRINGSETNKFYFYNDSRLGKGISYYRLKMTDTDGSVKYSKVIAIVNEEKGFVITSIAPNPVQHTASLTISAAKQSSVDFKVYDMTGNMVKQWQSAIASGINVVNMEVSALANGTYHVLASSADTRTVFRFIKQ